MLGLTNNYTVFDEDIRVLINSAFAELHSLGVGPENPFIIKGNEEKWDDFINNSNIKKELEAIKTYIYIKVRLIFDPPATSYIIKAYQDEINEISWRLNMICDNS